MCLFEASDIPILTELIKKMNMILCNYFFSKVKLILIYLKLFNNFIKIFTLKKYLSKCLYHDVPRTHAQRKRS